ncbi:MAG: TonB-dependent receptor [Campylobacterales bacterium]|nr:TonB-dependent receptor [Campylobacterales bacterium]
MTIMRTKALALLAPALLGANELGTIDVHGDHEHHQLEERKFQRSSDLALSAKGETLGDFLEKEQFVDSATYGAAVGRPVVKGMDGYRVGITQGNVMLNDLSAMSQDHAVGLMPRASQNIELIKGPASLLYGSYSGGVIRVLGEEHERGLKSGFGGDATLSSGSAAAGSVAGSSLYGGAGDWALSGSFYAHDAPEYDAQGSERVKDSDTQSLQGHLVSGYRADENHLFKLYGDWLSKEYGIPNTTHERTSIEMAQSRYGLVWHAARLFDALEHVQSELHYSDYLHSEWEGRSEDGLFGQEQLGLSTLFGFDVGAWHGDAHIEALQSDLRVCHEHGKCQNFSKAARTDATDGASLLGYLETTGLPFSHAHPMPDTNEAHLSAAVTLKRYVDMHELSLALRAAHRILESDPSNIQETWLVPQSLDAHYYDTRREDAISASLGYFADFDGLWSLQSSLGYVERLPSAQELYWNGFHHATDSYIFGDAHLDKERSINADAELIVHYGPWSTQVGGFYYHFEHYLYQKPLVGSEGSAMQDPFHKSAVWAMEGVGARIYGGALAQYYAQTLGAHRLEASLTLEALRGVIEGGGNLPRMAPYSATLELKHGLGAFATTLRYKRVDESRHEAQNESATEGFDWISARMEWTQKRSWGGYTLYVKGENLSDALAYNHLSFLKESAPLSGRQLSLGATLRF